MSTLTSVMGMAPLVLPELAVTLMQVGAFMLKVLFFCWLQILIRWTVPRFRYDQLMRLGWAIFLPLMLVNILLTAGALALGWTWLMWILPIALIGTALVVSYMGWKRDADKFQPLPTSPPAGGE